MTSTDPPLPKICGFPSEIWMGIAGRRNLENLVATCRTFRSIFTEFRDRHQVISLHKHTVKTRPEDPLPSWLASTQTLDVGFGERRIDGYKEGWNDIYAHHITKLIKAMPNLNSFSFSVDNTFQELNGLALIIQSEELLTTLATCPKFLHLAATFWHVNPDQFHAPAHGIRSYIPIKGFRNLKSLEIYQFRQADDNVFISELVQTLYNCPQLKKLGVGQECDFDQLYSHEYLLHYDNTDVLEQICKRYSANESTIPLELTTLRLGYGMFLFNSDSAVNENYLSKLVKLDGLKALHIWNGAIKREEDDDWSVAEHKWSMLKECTALRHVEVMVLNDGVLKWLNHHCILIEELVVTGHFNKEEGDVRAWDKLSSLKLTMLVVHESTCPCEDDGDDIEYAEDEEHTPGILMGIRGTRKISVLDRYFGFRLTRLSICMTFKYQWKQFANHLRAMPKLTQLHIQYRYHCHAGQFPDNSRWGGVTSPKDIAWLYARLAKWHCPSLQYVAIGSWAWHVKAEPGVELRSEWDIGDGIKLRELYRDEMLSIELFRYDREGRKAGLSDVRPGLEL
ncbi:uncharacterized protein PAC_03971 [Phialocephala subalpina]|uniref:F-box domain-containing protein n=1 Tax=Phialocephala subalpina TaxID=576137 RepID=A0A1L7WMW1_9HELO|nr:uncharacterized protein PAC_03971 [Phialocephala subalpina]